MKKLILILVPLALLVADDKTPKAKAKTAAPAAVTVPADATEIAPRVWRHTEKSGKTYIYRQTPFGLSKVEELAPSTAPAAAPAVEVKATDRGDTVHFEKPTPMGPRVWDRKKSDLTTEEKQWLEKSQASEPTAKGAEK
jgi:hypothetical protein